MKELYPFRLKAFYKKEGPDLRVTSSRIRSLVLVLMMAMLVFNYFIELNGHTLQNILFVLFFIIILTYPWAFNEREQKHQKLTGTAQFTENYIELIDINLQYKWEDVNELKIGAVRGEDIFIWVRMVGPKFSAGQDTFLNFKTGPVSKRLYFRFETYNDQRIFTDIIYDQYFRGNLKLTTVYNGLGIGYEEIQKLKELQKVENKT